LHIDPHSFRKLACGLIAAGAALPASHSLHAQSSSVDFRLEEVIVTARPREFGINLGYSF